MKTTAMVVMEPGSDWPGHISDSTNLVVASPEGDDLLLRAQERLRSLQRSETRVRVAVLACNAVTGQAAAARRGQVARALLGAVTRANFGRLVLGVSGRASQPVHQELMALAGSLTDELHGTTATVTLHFAEVSHGPSETPIPCASARQRR